MVSTIQNTQAVSVDTHLSEVLRLARPTATVQIPLPCAAGLVLGRDALAPFDLPSFDNSAMDGYAVRAEDVQPGERFLEVIGDIPAGCATGPTVTRGTAARIMTGAPLPHGADTVVPVEWADAIGGAVAISRMPRRGDNIRRAGEEMPAGQVAVRRGEILTPARIAVLASFGLPEVTVHRRPRVAVLTTGSELVSAGRPCPPGAGYDASARMLEALLSQDGAVVTALGHASDHEDSLVSAVRAAAAGHDMVVTTGGISADAYEVVKQALAPLGSMLFERVAMSPGSPQGVGTIDATPVLALPGNPSATFVSYLIFGRPFARHLLGQCGADQRWRQVALAAPCSVHADVTRFVPAMRDGERVIALEPGAGHRLSRLSAAHCLLRLEAGGTDLVVGALVPALEL